MRFYEYESRKLVEQAGIPVTKYGFATTADEARTIATDIGGPTVIKSQVLSGGRMKAGGVQFADTPDEAAEHAEAILKLEIDGRGVHMIDGKMQDDATWKQCKVMVELADQLAARDPELTEAYA